MTERGWSAVLCPLDGPDAPVAWAEGLAAVRPGRCLWLHVDPEDGSDALRWPETPASLPPIRVRVHREDPAEAVAEQVQAWGVELVVLASGGRTGWAKWFLPSVAQAIARSAGVATLLLRPGTPWPDPPRLRRILVPVDHDPRPEPALSEAARFARALGAEDGEIRLLYAGPVLDAPRVRPPAVPGWSWTEVVSDAPPVEAILSAAAAADLVVMASAGRRGLGDHLWGSTVERVFERCPCPLVRAVG